jgi:predicted dehydrogenase
MNRRRFLQSAPLAAAPAFAQSPAGTSPSAPSDRVRVAVIGCGGMGRNDLRDFQRQPDAEVVAVCDVYAPSAELARQLAGGKAQIYGDYRRILERKDIDAVVVATPDHWHALMEIDACAAGKDVYTEKPLSHSVREGRLMVEAARRKNRVVQVGIQQRSGAHFQRAAKAVREGHIGKVLFAQCWNHNNSPDPKGMGFPADATPPPPASIGRCGWVPRRRFPTIPPAATSARFGTTPAGN